ncbi:PREDICTED: glutamate receptor ionotropic, kainate 3-like [Priapulus caudatus]|uniref:Glutamate receptor ionotropic, kainate 3-like n=1 Tax=Priapulus caudatus TaxID=37621 RepID=A0ABM1ELE3_PRICU|nr:PREDICTED: glutamate receptor ionotropic, kainate 3-like [Priapulus caudatus]
MNIAESATQPGFQCRKTSPGREIQKNFPIRKTQEAPNFHGVELKVGFLNCSAVNTEISIINRNILRELGAYYNFTYSAIPFCNGGFSKVVAEVEAGRMDMACDVVTHPERAKQLRFLQPILHSYYVLLIKFPEKKTQTKLTIFVPFTTLTWVLIVACSLVITVLLPVLKYLSLSPDSPRYIWHGLSSAAVYVFGTLSNQGGTWVSGRIADRTLQFSWWMFVIVILSTYTGSLVSFLSVDTEVAYPFTSLHEAANYPITPIIVPGFIAEALLKESPPESDLGKMWKKALADPDAVVHSADEAIDRLLTGKYTLFVESDWYGTLHAQRDYRRSGECRLAMVPITVLPTSTTCVLAYGDPYYERLNDGITILHQSGILQKWTDDMLKVPGCLLEQTSVSANVILLPYLQNLFTFLLLGVLVGGCCLCIELLISFMKYLEDKKQSRTMDCERVRVTDDEQ